MLDIMSDMNTKGFTLIELLVVIAIIGLLSSVVLASVNRARESARVSRTAEDIRSIKNAFAAFSLDTNANPGRCRIQNNCSVSTDPFLNDLGAIGWYGPYVSGAMYNRTHAWGGHMGIENHDYDSDGVVESFLVLDDDIPNGVGGNDGRIPSDSILELDEKIDDGNLSTGRFMTNVSGVSTGEGSAVYLMLPF